MNRRNFIRNSALATAAASIAPSLVREAAAAVPGTNHFYFPGSGGQYFAQAALHDVTVMQSFAFDNVNKWIFTAQLTSGGGSGDLTITKLSLGGTELGYMKIKGCGHGVAIGAEPSGTSTYLWTEANAQGTGGDARGNQIARFKFVDGTTLSSSSMTRYTMVPGSTTNSCTIDPVYNRLIVSYNDGGQKFNIYNLSDVKTNGAAATVLARYSDRTTGTRQGYTLCGSYIYSYSGDAYDYCPGSDSRNTNNATLFEFDTNSGVLTTFVTGAGASYDFREPQGMAIHIPDMSQPTKPRLAFGFARISSCGSTTKYATIFYKDQFVA